MASVARTSKGADPHFMLCTSTSIVSRLGEEESSDADFSQQSSAQCLNRTRLHNRPGYGQQHGMRIAHHAVRELAAPIILGPCGCLIQFQSRAEKQELLISGTPLVQHSQTDQLSCLESGKRCTTLRHLSDFVRFCFVMSHQR